MTPAALRERLRSRKVQLVLALVLIAALAGLFVVIATGSRSVRVTSRFVAGTPEAGRPVQLDTSLYLPRNTPAPAILLSQGFGGDKSSLDGEARTLAEHGFVVLPYSARGFGASGGLIHFDSPDYEVRDGERLLDYLTGLSQVERAGGRPQLAVAGSSYGGALSLLIAAADHRVEAVAADITWNDLGQALFPNSAGSGPGPFKRLWAGALFANALPGRPGTSVTCGRFAPDVCAAYQASAAAGAPTPAMRTLMEQASPARVLGDITAPTLLTQGEQDSLFPLSQADANARGIAAHGTPVRVVWRTGGHDTGGGTGTATDAALSWFDDVFDGPVSTHQPFRLAEQAGVVSAATGDASQEILQADGYPGIAGVPQRTDAVTVSGAAQDIGSPAGGAPSVVTSIPGLGGVLDLLNRSSSSSVSLPPVPGQTATFLSAPLARSQLVAGASTVTLQVTTRTTTDAVLFASLRDDAPDGTSTLPAQLVAPIRLTGLTPGQPRTVTVQLPSFVRTIAAGHQLALTVSASDFAYAGPADAREYTIGLAGGSAAVRLPTLATTTVAGGTPVAWLVVGVIVFVVVLGAVAVVIVRRRLVLRSVPELADVPVSIESLVKEYSGGYRAVDDISFRVERGQVVGLLGPNGAGKTTTLRVLVGLITPTSGTVHVFGEPVVPGAPVLARLGAFIEGPGFLPHLSGRENLRLYWAATGRPAAEADFDTALDIAGLGASVDRRVRTYSHGMKQRLGIAQAMLGLPELLILDEPTNGLDPPQIAEMREVLQRYAQTGRTVVVSSHLLAEVEQTCTHVVVMHRGRVVAAGATVDIAGAGGVQLAVADLAEASRVLAAAGIAAELVPA
ncbi:MAG: alpha/beta fold hydrolase, partial [Actinobacteria bacterium]|nr:alpha/beta fold hydrolase [Actinomycetota bacterium]